MSQFFDENASDYDSFINLMTFGSDFAFKSEILANVLLYGGIKYDYNYTNILELGSGTGLLTIELAKLFPQARIIAIDSSAEYIQIAQAKSDELGIENIRFIRGDAYKVNKLLESGYKADLIIGAMFPKYLTDCFDHTCNFTRNLREISHEDTLIILQDISLPENALFQMIYTNHVNFVTETAKSIPKWKPLAEVLPMYAKNNWQKMLPLALEEAGFKTWSISQPLEISTIIFAEL